MKPVSLLPHLVVPGTCDLRFTGSLSHSFVVMLF